MSFLIYFFSGCMLKGTGYRVMGKGFRSWLLRRPFVSATRHEKRPAASRRAFFVSVGQHGNGSL
jgi:hypothetical protein